jgi:hypothetical protein
MRRSNLLLFAFVALAVFPLWVPINFPADDALFYMQVARNIAAGHGSTFNNITPTNGYHPLWMIICAAAAAIAHGDRILILRVVFAIQAVLSLFVLWRFRSLIAPVAPSGWVVGLAVVAPYFLTGMYGSEAHLNGALLILGCGALIAASRRADLRSFAVLGAVLGLAVLARLDDVFVAATFLVTAALSSAVPWRRRIAVLLAGGLAMSAVVMPYLAYNAIRFGGPLPVSGVIKSTFPHVTGRFSNLGSLGAIVMVGGLASIVVAASSRVGHAGSESTARAFTGARTLLLALGLGVLLHVLYVVAFTNHLTHWSWYYVPGVVNLGVLAAAVWEALAGSWSFRRQSRLAGVVALVLFCAAFARGAARAMNPQAVGNNQLQLRLSRGDQRWTVSLAQWLDHRLPPEAGVMAYDYPGALAFYSFLRVLPEDGLIGDYAYNRELVREGAAGYLRAHGVNYYMGPFDADGNGLVEVFAPLGRRSAGFLQLRRKNLIVRVRDLPHMTGAPDVAIWWLGP